MLTHHTAPPAPIGVRVQSVELSGAVYRDAVGGSSALVRQAYAAIPASLRPALVRRFVLTAGPSVSLVKVTA